MKFSLNHEKYSKDKISHIQRLVQILEKRAIMINFDYIRTYSIIKKRISCSGSSEILQLNQLLQNQNSYQAIHRDSQLTKKGSIVLAIQEWKIKNITQQINEFQYETSNTKVELKKIIELERKRKNIKQNLKDNKIMPKSYEEKLYEICLAFILIIFFFTFGYTIIHELKE